MWGILMDSYNTKGIKDIIAEFPDVGNILEEYGIGCGPCTVGICQLKDILDIHKMEPEKERELMTRIESVIYPEREIKTSFKKKITQTETVEHEFSQPMQRLVNEHVLIKRWLALIPFVIKDLDLTSAEGVQIVIDGIDLIRSYADRLHHAKEEDILFRYFDDTTEIFQVIYEDHKKARNHVKEMLAAIDTKSEKTLSQHLAAYGELLVEHIKKEDEILFPWLDRKLTAAQIIELSEKFEQEDLRLGIDSEKYRLFLNQLEKHFGLAS